MRISSTMGIPTAGTGNATYADQFAELTIPAAAEQTLLAGVTSVRDLGAPAEDILAVKRRIDSGELPGPTFYPAGPILQPGETQGRANTLPVSSVDDARIKTRRLLGDGVHIIKFHASSGGRNMPLEVARAIVEEAHAQGVKVTTHGRSDEDIRVGLAADVDEFQHIGTGSPEYPTDIVQTIRERIRSGRALYWTPTVGMQLNIERATDLEFLDDPSNFVGMPPDLEDEVRTALANTEPSNPPAPDSAAILKRKIAQLRELGVILVAGTDMGTYGMPAGQSLWRDLDVWVREFGLAPMTAIRWVTADAAEALGVADDYGTVAVGKYADVIAVRGNPLMHINVLRDPAIVIKHGRRYK